MKFRKTAGLDVSVGMERGTVFRVDSGDVLASRTVKESKSENRSWISDSDIGLGGNHIVFW